MIFTIRQHSQIAKLFISFSMKCLLAITGFAALAIATPTLPRAPTPTGQVPSPPTVAQLGFYQNPSCSHTGTYWYFTYWRSQYEALLEQTGGCQNVSEPMGGYATAIQVQRQVAENCKGIFIVFCRSHLQPAKGSALGTVANAVFSNTVFQQGLRPCQ